jgi:hypothetical protein
MACDRITRGNLPWRFPALIELSTTQMMLELTIKSKKVRGEELP